MIHRCQKCHGVRWLCPKCGRTRAKGRGQCTGYFCHSRAKRIPCPGDGTKPCFDTEHECERCGVKGKQETISIGLPSAGNAYSSTQYIHVCARCHGEWASQVAVWRDEWLNASEARQGERTPSNAIVIGSPSHANDLIEFPIQIIVKEEAWKGDLRIAGPMHHDVRTRLMLAIDRAGRTI